MPCARRPSLAALVLWLVACAPSEAPAPAPTSKAPETEPSASETKSSVPEAKPETKAPPKAVEVPQWACTSKADCVQTCALGAVTLAWIKAHPEADTCDDGCGWKSGQIACRDGECVTLTEAGDIDESCTKREAR